MTIERPESLTENRLRSFLPTRRLSPEWERRKETGQLQPGMEGLAGMLEAVWPDEQPTADEARWILEFSEHGTLRWLAGELLNDENQIFGMDLIEAAERVLGVTEAER